MPDFNQFAQLLHSTEERPPQPNILGALQDRQFYTDTASNFARLLDAGIQDVLPAGPPPALATKLGVPADPQYQAKMTNMGIAGLTAFHGSPHNFSKIDITKLGTGASKGLIDQTAGVVWATNNPTEAGFYASGRTLFNQHPEGKSGFVHKVHADITNPYYFEDGGMGSNPADRMAAIDYARSKGHDAVIFSKSKEPSDMKDADIAFLNPDTVTILGQ